jgi:hypothetical protein
MGPSKFAHIFQADLLLPDEHMNPKRTRGFQGAHCCCHLDSAGALGPILKSFRGKEASGMVAQQRLKSTARQAGRAARLATRSYATDNHRRRSAGYCHAPAGDHRLYLRAAVGPQKWPIAPWISSACDFNLER